MDFPEIKEIDINPFGIDKKGGVVLDAKIILDKESVGKKPYSHLVISPYPREYIAGITMKNGKKALLRPIKPEDESMLKVLFSSLSEQTQKLRFFNVIKDISHELLISFTQPDYDREIPMVAELEDEKKIIGLARLVADPYNKAAEFSVVVSDNHQGTGLGSIFLDKSLEIARSRGVQKVFARFSGDNNVMKIIFEKRGFAIKQEADLYVAELQIK
jgi:acetyltransferase